MPVFTDSARALLKRLEGCRLAAYRDQAGVWTIGYGHTGAGVVRGLVWTQAQADLQLSADIARFSAGVARLVAPVQLTDAQFSALVIFAFNVGLVALEGSTALRDVHAGNLAGVPGELAKWCHIHDRSGVPVVDPGLVARRNAEIALWRSGSTPERNVA